METENRRPAAAHPRLTAGSEASGDQPLKREPSHFADRELVLIYIAKRLSEALEVESAFTGDGLDYCVEADEYHGGFLFRTTRTGAFFYVAVDEEGRAEEVLLRIRRKPLTNELRQRH